MARGKKAAATLTLEEKLQQALVPVEEQPYEIPKNWCWVRLSNLSEIISKGTTPRGGKDAYVSEGVNFLRVENINDDGTISHDNIAHVTEEMHTGFLKRSVLQKDDILISIAGTLGKTGIVQEVDLPLNTNQAVSFVRLKDERINRNYIKLSIDSPRSQELLLGKTKVTSIPNLTLEIIGDCLIPLCPLAEQQRIVDRIESIFAKLDEAKEKAQAVVEGFELRKSTILHKAFTGELTAQWRQEHSVGLDSWEESIMQDVCEKITCGKTPKEYISQSGDIPYLKVYNIVNNEIDFNTTPQYIPREIHETKLKSSMLKPHDVIMNIVGPPLRKIAIIPDTYNDWNMNQAIVRFRPKERLSYKYLYYWLVYPKTLEEVISDTRGVVGQANISVSQSRALSIVVPCFEEQQKIVEILESILNKEQQAKDAGEMVVDQIDAVKKAVLARAFRGELGTNDPAEESAIELLKEVLNG